MDMMLDVVKEELQNSIRIRDGYRKAISGLPRGSLSKKRINGKEYYYLSFWGPSGGVVTRYLGKLSDDQVQHYREKIQRRKEYQKLMKKSEEQVKFYMKVLAYGRKDKIRGQNPQSSKRRRAS
ncbi:MAG: hypothetical protein RDV48_31465 [Candidatus Eremiobacteraeota bacterium]|nr:hypothetical protein [Candidatus Eremiobacteraeota bacterium]